MKSIDLERDPIWKIYEGLAHESEHSVLNYTKQSRRFRASEIAGCRRKIWYRLGGFVPLPKYPWLEMVGAAGDLGHDYFRYLANHYEMGLGGITFDKATGKQEEIDNAWCDYDFNGQKFTLSCRPDGSMLLPEVPTDAVLEVKTVTSFAFDKAERAWKKGGNQGVIDHYLAEKPNFLWQGNQSAMILKKTHIYLLVIDRNLNRIGFGTEGFGKKHGWEPLAGKRAGGCVWELEESDKENILYKAAAITEALNGDVPPPAPEFLASSNECGQCDFFIYCHGKKKKMEYPIPGVVS